MEKVNKEEEYLYKLWFNKKVKYPYKCIIKHPRKGVLSTEFIVDSRKDVWKRMIEIRQATRRQYKCFFCNQYFKEDKGGRWMPMDKRESGDGLFGHAFACYKCVPKEYGRL